MRAAWYERQGPARDVLTVGTMADPQPGPGELRIQIAASGINPGDVRKRQNAFGYGMPYPRVVPHADGAGCVDRVGAGVSADWVGRRVWCYGAQTYRPFGTAAEYTVVPETQAVPLPDRVSMEQGACLGIPGITAHRALHVAGPVDGRTVLVQGGAGAVGLGAVQLARRAGALVIATVRSTGDTPSVTNAGAQHVLPQGPDLAGRVRALAADGVNHVIDVAFGANIHANLEMLALGGSIAAYATDAADPAIPFWPLLFKNVRLFFVGSDDVPVADKMAAARALNEALEAGWSGFEIAERFPLDRIADAHEWIERPPRRGRVIIVP
jgi:NADPH2:quinone reductase